MLDRLKEDGPVDNALVVFWSDHGMGLQRAARDRRWKYIRNLEPEKPYSRRLDCMDAVPAMQARRRLAGEGRLSGGQKN